MKTVISVGSETLWIQNTLRVWGLSCSFIVFFIKIPISYTSLLQLRPEYFLKPNIGSGASSENKNKSNDTGYSEGQKNTSRERENGGGAERDEVNLIWGETDSLEC